MNSTRSQSSKEASLQGEGNLHFLLFAPPQLVRDKIFLELFSQAVTDELQEQTDRGSLVVARHYDPKLDLYISDLSTLDISHLNHAILSTGADAALIIIDAACGPEKRDLWAKALVCLAAIPRLIVAIDNMGSCGYSQSRFETLREEIVDHAAELECGGLDIVPVDFSYGANIKARSDQLSWTETKPLVPLLADIKKASKTEQPSQSTSQNSDQFAVHLCWMANTPMLPSRHYVFDNGDRRLEAHVSSLKHRFNPETMEHQAAKCLFSGNVGYANLSLEDEIAFRPFQENRKSGSFYLRDRDTDETLAFGLIKHGLRRATNIHWQPLEIDKEARADNKHQKPCVLWFTGLSGSGKSAIASLVEKKLHAFGKHTYVLDGDNVRHGLCRDLGFTDADRVENLRRISETTKLFVDAGLIVLVSFISPFHAERAAARELFEEDEFLEIYVNTPLEICEQRDPKGLYKKARAGNLKHFTGIDSPYESPKNAEIVLNSVELSTDELADQIITQMEKSGLLNIETSPQSV